MLNTFNSKEVINLRSGGIGMDLVFKGNKLIGGDVTPASTSTKVDNSQWEGLNIAKVANYYNIQIELNQHGNPTISYGNITLETIISTCGKIIDVMVSAIKGKIITIINPNKDSMVVYDQGKEVYKGRASKFPGVNLYRYISQAVTH